ncbi:hypothetical protein F751_5076 [Auxenochlorella protothecoides]|uniref:Uncharacterized protein n=1 Tax=Auxenochlorella protothecoides TaxID=3075 RepID=A0A087SET0_AUXPR|nr:hypothetical protein F751_5076 [Auxenochlorella protothecoides]KFM24234.1 hypothetical protein F751_5076 [Auxenochlorella protothecoides]
MRCYRGTCALERGESLRDRRCPSCSGRSGDLLLLLAKDLHGRVDADAPACQHHEHGLLLLPSPNLLI